jgi:phthalate 4,5-cis-dihydrodiol dehydrogenase
MVIRKPMALTMGDCQRILDLADKNRVKVLAGGQTGGTNPVIRKIRQMILSNELGPLRAINFWAYRDWMLSARMPQEVDETLGGGIVWRQAPHHIEAARWLGGGLVRSVRATTGRWQPERPDASGYYSAFLEFEDGTPVTMVYNGNGYFDTVELTPWGEDRGMEHRLAARRALRSGQVDEPRAKEAGRFGGFVQGESELRIPWEREGREWSASGMWLPGNQGVFIVSCQNGDIRMSPRGIYVYDDEGKREVPVPGALAPGERMPFVDAEAMELFNAVRHDQPMLHDGRWGMATAEVQWAIVESARQRRELTLEHQVPVPEGF